MRGIRRVLAGALAWRLVTTLAACANDPLAEQYRSGDNKGFIAADGFQVVEIPAERAGRAGRVRGHDRVGRRGVECRLRG